MSFREKVRKVFRRDANPKSNASTSGIKIEYYRRGEIPPSKFKGPFDKEHQRRLAAWSFQQAQADRPRSIDLSLSPCATLPDYLNQAPSLVSGLSDGATASIYHDEFARDRQGTTTGSLSSITAVDPESFSDSTMTLFLDPLEDDLIINVKNSVRHTSSPIIHTVSSPPLPVKGAPMPFTPEDLTRALNAVQIYT
ncbi:hypothetical protein P175DRAFT_0503956 [Aspergillus ochraceoroseus IBT 24754]|uniref:Uncharacterized protein n=3 Tax=Aspergillus subgen. Nidulantes TaxID=2720870 RepID=A0A0F8V1Z6_9EURO|nr:uncharacterized protein P175DRAFT_0503956 [Aspergillus ochraceoroseus IBT 24754]KKK13122.1 hypothetical protein AOCH_007690 [Aspergillus ochraceoroseus]KKK25779.1 hypothetical protein ARAM_002045 [Aspergillus rambellii]PTU18069.1 hypothetical protein P175DRAFT_0503956 [Aspergillus ochraceoroseus IBT 24754]